jgi:hypothetical protein
MAPARAMQRMFAAWRCVQTLSTLNELLVVIVTHGMFAAWRCVQMLSRGLVEATVCVQNNGWNTLPSNRLNGCNTLPWNHRNGWNTLRATTVAARRERA